MTRATRLVKDKEGNLIARPTVRLVLTFDGAMHLEVTDREATLRPVGARRGGAREVTLSWGKIYLRAMRDKVDAELAAKKKAKKERARLRGGR